MYDNAAMAKAWMECEINTVDCLPLDSIRISSEWESYTQSTETASFPNRNKSAVWFKMQFKCNVT
jgi:hypothetical protein